MPSITDSFVLHFLLKAVYFKKNKPQAYSLLFLKLSSLAADTELWTSIFFFFKAQRINKLEGNEHLSKTFPVCPLVGPSLYDLCRELGQASKNLMEKI